MNVRVLVCCHKDDVRASEPPYYPIHVGKATSKVDLHLPGDDTGDNISSKNKSYCELTGMYWAWKNLKDIDIIGLCHYRRYFDFHNQCQRFMPHEVFPIQEFSSLDIAIPDKILRKVHEGQIVVAKPRYYLENLATNYCVAHVSEDFRTLQHVIETTQPKKIIDAFHAVMYQSNALVPYNMFLMRWTDFDNYCKWLFQILEEVERRTDISRYSPVQSRIYGYMGERLFNVWLKAYGSTIIHKPVLLIAENNNFGAPEHYAKNNFIFHLEQFLLNFSHIIKSAFNAIKNLATKGLKKVD